MLIQKMRVKRGWSQQQLADISSLSIRTIQRIEAGQPASAETLKSLAAVFEVDFSTLNTEPSMDTSLGHIEEKLEAEAFLYVRRLRSFYFHLLHYSLVVSGLFVVNLIVSPHRMWVLWVVTGWGMGVLIHAARVFRPSLFLGPKWERVQVEKRLGRPL